VLRFNESVALLLHLIDLYEPNPITVLIRDSFAMTAILDLLFRAGFNLPEY
jgi:hypothetical protein